MLKAEGKISDAVIDNMQPETDAKMGGCGK